MKLFDLKEEKKLNLLKKLKRRNSKAQKFWSNYAYSFDLKLSIYTKLSVHAGIDEK